MSWNKHDEETYTNQFLLGENMSRLWEGNVSWNKHEETYTNEFLLENKKSRLWEGKVSWNKHEETYTNQFLLGKTSITVSTAH